MSSLAHRVRTRSFEDELAAHALRELDADHVAVFRTSVDGEAGLLAVAGACERRVGAILVVGRSDDGTVSLEAAFGDEVSAERARGRAEGWATLASSALAERSRLDRSEALHRELVEQMPAMLYLCDLDGNTLYASPRCGTVLGYDSDRWRDDPDALWEECIHPDDRGWAFESWREAIAAQRPHTIEYRCLHRDGRTIWIREIETIVNDADGRPAYRHGVGFDVTEAVEAGIALRESEAQYRTLLDKLPCVVYRLGSDGYTTYANPAAYGMLGYSYEEWRDDPDDLWASRVHPEDRAWVSETWDRAMAANAPYQIEYRILAKDGSTAWVEESEWVVCDDAGGELFRQGLMLDITRQKRTEQLLAAGERWYRHLVERMPAAVYADDGDGRPLYVSPRIEQLFGCTPGAWIADPELWAARIHPDDRERVETAYADHIARGAPYADRYRIVRVSGEVRWVTDLATMVTSEGRTQFVEGLLIDVTGESGVELGHLEAAAGLQEQSLQLLVETLFSLDKVVDAARGGRLDHLEPAVRVAQEMVVGSAQQMRSRETSPAFVPAVGGLAAAVRLMARRAADESGFALRLETSIGRHAEPIEALAYRFVFEAVGNVCRHARAAGLVVTLRDRCGWLEGTVRDDGVGFDPRRLLSRVGDGSGPGLPAVIARIRVVGGECTVESAPGAGTQIGFRLPIGPRQIG